MPRIDIHTDVSPLPDHLKASKFVQLTGTGVTLEAIDLNDQSRRHVRLLPRSPSKAERIDAGLRRLVEMQTEHCTPYIEAFPCDPTSGFSAGLSRPHLDVSLETLAERGEVASQVDLLRDLRSLIRCVRELHSNHVLHLGVTSKNVGFVDGQLTTVDWGILSEVLHPDATSSPHVAPERKVSRCTAKTDVYDLALGFLGPVLRHSRREISTRYGPNFTHLVDRLITESAHDDARRRPTVDWLEYVFEAGPTRETHVRDSVEVRLASLEVYQRLRLHLRHVGRDVVPFRKVSPSIENRLVSFAGDEKPVWTEKPLAIRATIEQAVEHHLVDKSIRVPHNPRSELGGRRDVNEALARAEAGDIVMLEASTITEIENDANLWAEAAFDDGLSQVGVSELSAAARGDLVRVGRVLVESVFSDIRNTSADFAMKARASHEVRDLSPHFDRDALMRLVKSGDLLGFSHIGVPYFPRFQFRQVGEKVVVHPVVLEINRELTNISPESGVQPLSWWFRKSSGWAESPRELVEQASEDSSLDDKRLRELLMSRLDDSRRMIQLD